MVSLAAKRFYGYFSSRFTARAFCAWNVVISGADAGFAFLIHSVFERKKKP